MIKLKRVLCTFVAVILLLTNSTSVFGLSNAVYNEYADNEEGFEKFVEEEQEESKHGNKTNRYIIKYKDGVSDKDLSKKTKNKLGKIKIKKGNAYGKLKNNGKGKNKKVEPGEMLFVEIEDELETEQFKALIKENEDMSDIEYIQPDYELSLSDIITDEIEIDMTEEEEIIEISEDAEKVESQDIVEETSDSDIVLNEDNNETEQFVNVDSFNIDDSLTAAFSVSTGEGITIAVVDSAIDISHEQLEGHITTGWDFIRNIELNSEAEQSIVSSHGTHIAGIIAKCAPASLIMPLTVFENGNAFTSDIIAAIEYATENAVDIVNCSWGCSDENLALKEAMENSGLLFVCAAGNNRMNVDMNGIYPASYGLDNIISVGSINNDGGMSYFSNYGETVDITAWGREIESFYPQNEIGNMTGTSVSAAFVSGAAALVAAKNSTTDGLKTELKSTADKLSCLAGKVADGNKLNFYNAVNGTSGVYANIEPEDDFDVFGYERTPSENWELFANVENVKAAAGSSHTIVLKEDGTVWQFGYVGETYPVQVAGLTNIVDIAAYEYSNIALDASGRVYTWSSGVPMPIGAIGSIVAVDRGQSHCIALDSEGTVWTWGSNPNGQLGIGDSADREYNKVLANVVQISCGAEHCIALLDDGTIKVWGENSRGQLGLGTTENANSPQLIEGLTDVKKVVAGAYHSVIIKEDGSVWTCGSGGYGQIGQNKSTNSSEFTQIMSGVSVTDVFTNYHHNVAVDDDGKAWGWGYNTYSQLGINSTPKIMYPKQIAGADGVISAAIGLHHTVFVMSDGKIKACGNNMHGQLGVERTLSSDTSIMVKGLSNIVSIAAGENSTFAIGGDATLYAWGDNTYGQLGDGTKISRGIPAKVKCDGADFNGVSKVAVGKTHTVAVKTDGTVWSWGNNGSGQLGINSTKSSVVPTQIPQSFFDDKQIIDVACGENYTIVRAEDGSVYAWGVNSKGELGIGNTTSPQKAPVSLGINAKAITAGANHSAAILSNDKLVTWGYNNKGQLGTGDCETRVEPTEIANYSNDTFVSVDAGVSSTFAVKTDGSVIGFGVNTNNCLGESVGNYTNEPVVISGLSNIEAVAYGVHHGIALGNDNNVYLWGRDNYGQLCSTSQKTAVSDLTGTQMIAAGRNHNVILKDGAVYSWGDNSCGQLGNGDVLVVESLVTPDSAINYFYGTSFEDAYQIAPGTISSGIATPEEAQYFKIVAPDTANYTIRSSSESPADLTLKLYDANHTLVAEGFDWNSGYDHLDDYENSKDFVITKGLTKGSTYYLKVMGDASDIPYEFTIEKHYLTANQVRYTSFGMLNISGKWIPAGSVEIILYENGTQIHQETVIADGMGNYMLNSDLNGISLGRSVVVDIIGHADIDEQINRALISTPGVDFDDAVTLPISTGDSADEFVKIETKTNVQDVQYYAINVEETGNYAIYSDIDSPFDLRAELYDENQVLISSNDMVMYIDNLPTRKYLKHW